MDSSDDSLLRRLAIPVAVVLLLVAGGVGYTKYSRAKAAQELARLESVRQAADLERVALQMEADRVKREAADAQLRETQKQQSRSNDTRFRYDDHYRQASTFQSSVGGGITSQEVARAVVATEYERQAAERRSQNEADQALRLARADADRQARWVKQQEQEEERIRLQRSYKR